jgi:nicotinate-nucleotide adenylyltransferase
VTANPGHKPTVLDPAARLELARLAFAALPDTDVRLDDHAFTVDLLRDEQFQDAVLVIGADQWAVFDTWKEPDAILRLIPVAVAARPGQPVPAAGDVEVFEIEQHPVASSEIRELIARGQPLDDVLPAAVAREIENRGLYGGARS